VETPSRREMFKWAGASAAGAAVLGPSAQVSRAAAAGPAPYTLPDLPYACNALAPVIDERTLRIHHDRHHAGYVRGLNAALGRLNAARGSGDMASIQALSQALAFHGSGHVLHTLYFANLSPRATQPTAPLTRAIVGQFGSLRSLTTQLAAATATVAGSGWGMLAFEPIGRRLFVLQIEKHENQMVCGAIPLLVIDVWEHAYYLHYQNRRTDYIKAIMTRIHWAEVGRRFGAALRLCA